jgi:hypothetical protein
MLGLESAGRQRTVAGGKPIQISVGQNGFPHGIEHCIDPLVVFGAGKKHDHIGFQNGDFGFQQIKTFLVPVFIDITLISDYLLNDIGVPLALWTFPFFPGMNLGARKIGRAAGTCIVLNARGMTDILSQGFNPGQKTGHLLPSG